MHMEMDEYRQTHAPQRDTLINTNIYMCIDGERYTPESGTMHTRKHTHTHTHTHTADTQKDRQTHRQTDTYARTHMKTQIHILDGQP